MPEFKVCAVKARRIDASSELVELFSHPAPTETDGHAAS
jgi:hypothetical protein